MSTITVRDNTERPVTVTCGTDVIAGTTQGWYTDRYTKEAD